jgi:AcrR family transcriptional regulator
MPRTKAKLRPRRRPVQGRSHATVEAVLEATARILVRRGWAGLTTNHVAAAAGVSVGTLYEYFPSKEALVRQLVDRHLARAESLLEARIAELLADPRVLTTSTLARVMVDAMIELHADDPRLHRVLFEEVPHDATVRARVRALEDAATAALATALPKLPGVAVRDHAVAARIIVDLLESLTHRWITDPGNTPIAPRRLAAELTRLVVAYLERAP